MNNTMTKVGKIKIISIILAILLVFGTLVALAGNNYIQSQFLETIYIYIKFGILVAADLSIYFSQKIFGLLFSSWKLFIALLIVFAILVVRWLFNYTSE